MPTDPVAKPRRVCLLDTLLPDDLLLIVLSRVDQPAALLALAGTSPRLRRLADGEPLLWRRLVAGECSRRRDCHFADIPSPSLLKHLLKAEGGAAE